MSNLALLLLIAALAFASLTWGVYGLQRRRELKRSARAREALLGPASPALPRPIEPARLPGGLASGVSLTKPPRSGTPATQTATASAEAFGANVPTSDDRLEAGASKSSSRLDAGASTSSGRLAASASKSGSGLAASASKSGSGLEAGAFESKARVDNGALEGQSRLRAGESNERGETTPIASGGNSASEVMAAADAASAAASAAAAAPEASIVSIEPGQPSDTTVVAAKPDTDADRAPAVVLVHGILGFDHLKVLRWRFHYFRGVADHLRRVGVNAYVVRVPALDAIPARALALAEFVKALPHRHVTLVAHSMGGLDARYAITHLGLAERVPVLVTVATPHRGTPLADLLARRTASMARRLAAKLGIRSEAIECLTTERMARFNEEVPDAPGVTYACVPCGRRARPGAIHPLLRPTHAYLRRVAGPNDGLVPVSSQLWGAVVEEIEADHWAQVGWSHRFDAPLFYADVVVHLSKLGLLAAPSFAELPPARAPLRLGPATTTTVAPAGVGLEPRPLGRRTKRAGECQTSAFRFKYEIVIAPLARKTKPLLCARKSGPPTRQRAVSLANTWRIAPTSSRQRNSRKRLHLAALALSGVMRHSSLRQTARPNCGVSSRRLLDRGCPGPLTNMTYDSCFILALSSRSRGGGKPPGRRGVWKAWLCTRPPHASPAT